MKALIQRTKFVQETAGRMRVWCKERFTADRWLDENEREWYALDRLCRSRPWARNRDKAFPYPFRDATRRMIKVEGDWVGGSRPDISALEARRPGVDCEVISPLNCPPHFPPEHRVLLFAPEFGSDRSFDMDMWSFIEPDDQVDLSVVCWKGWSNFDAMIKQVLEKVLSFADGVNTVWFGQGMGAIVAYELLKLLELQEIQTPNLPVALVISDCPAPHVFSEKYRPYSEESWLGQVAQYSAMRQKEIEEVVSMMKSYRFHHGERKKLLVPVAACCHTGRSFFDATSVQAWADYSPEPFAFHDLGESQEQEWYLDGLGPALQPEPALLSVISTTCCNFSRWNDADYPDIGPVDGSIPTEVDCVIVGAGIAGIYQAKVMDEASKSLVVFDRYHIIGGVWEFYGNDYSRVNTSEIGYRVLDKKGMWTRPNEDHTPRRDIMRDIYEIASKHAYGKIRCRTDVTKVEKQNDGTYIVRVRTLNDGVEHTVKAKAVSFQVNRRIGKRRIVDWQDSEKFKGIICYGYGNEPKDIDFWNKRVLVIGAGAFAFENVRTSIEHGARQVTLLGRRDGTTCPKWIDMIAFLRPIDSSMQTNKAGNMISFEVWQKCYQDAGIRPPGCWSEGLLKPHNHTISVSDLAFIGGYHGLVDLRVGEIARIRQDGRGVQLRDGSEIDVDIIIKCTGFHLNDEVPEVVGSSKMQSYGLIDYNLNYQAEPLLDQGQFGSSKSTDAEAENPAMREIVELYQTKDFLRGLELYRRIGLDEEPLKPQGNPFGSGQGGPIDFLSYYFAWLVDHPDEQAALLKHGGPPSQEMVKLWSSAIGQNNTTTLMRLICALAELEVGPAEGSKAALLFPGQGSQFVGMLAKCKDNPTVQKMISSANDILGYDLLEVCLQGPEEKLSQTSICQPAVFLAGMAALEVLRETRPEAVNKPRSVAGLSLGEYCALCAAGVFEFEDAMKLVMIRGAAMAEAAASRPQAMVSIAGLAEDVVTELCKRAVTASGEGEVCQIANVLFKKGFACAGTKAAIDKLKEAAEKEKAMQAKLIKTSGGFHTDLMKPAAKTLDDALASIAPRMKPPRCDVYMNATGQKLAAGTSVEEIVSLLSKQLCSPVLWEPSMQRMIDDGVQEFYEVGPDKQLRAMMKRIDQSAWSCTTNVDI
ncbi:Mcat [Symbiodinium pilosum]|uniref:Mcat protein n=1 Tax=Symbiodinium pilosum TaxID=2952 RepID=A0A812T8Y9_SYMPI|nr:Mcat [Symbiodinium pilosum]